MDLARELLGELAFVLGVVVEAPRGRRAVGSETLQLAEDVLKRRVVRFGFDPFLKGGHRFGRSCEDVRVVRAGGIERANDVCLGLRILCEHLEALGDDPAPGGAERGGQRRLGGERLDAFRGLGQPPVWVRQRVHEPVQLEHHLGDPVVVASPVHVDEIPKALRDRSAALGVIELREECLQGLAPEQVGLVRVEELHVRVEVDPVEPAANELVAEGVDGRNRRRVEEYPLPAEPAVARIVLQPLRGRAPDAGAHLGRGGLSERDDEQTVHFTSRLRLADKVRAAFGQHVRLAGAGRGGDEEAAPGRPNGLLLRGRQLRAFSHRTPPMRRRAPPARRSCVESIPTGAGGGCRTRSGKTPRRGRRRKAACAPARRG